MSEQQGFIRDMDLVRGLLMWAAQHAQPQMLARQPEAANFSPDIVGYHIRIMSEEGLLKAVMYADGSWGIGQLTWKGQDFLQASQDESVWEQAKQKAGDAFSSLPLDILMALLKQVLRDRLGINF